MVLKCDWCKEEFQLTESGDSYTEGSVSVMGEGTFHSDTCYALYLQSNSMSYNKIWEELSKIPGGYTYSGAASLQICFPLRDGGELRFSLNDDDTRGDFPAFGFDFYDGSLPPGITGPWSKTAIDKAP